MPKQNPTSSVFSFPEDVPYARQIARRLRLPSHVIWSHQFPDGETLVSVGHKRIVGSAILVRRLDHPNAKIADTLFAADAVRRAGVSEVTLCVPYFPYLRQDKLFHAGEALSAKVFGDLIGRGFDRVITIDPHLHRIRALSEVVPCRTQHVSAAEAIARWIRRNCPSALAVGPDVESSDLVKAVAERAGIEWIVARKRRLADKKVKVELDGLPTAGSAIIVDDIGSTGVTLAAIAQALRSRGFGPIDAVVVHALFAKDAIPRIRRAGVRRIVSSDTIAHLTNAIKTAPLIALALMGPKS